MTASHATTFTLDDPHTVTLVHDGRVDVFAVSKGDPSEPGLGPRSGPRRHLWTASAGATLFGFDLSTASTTLVGVATGNASIRQMTLCDMIALGRTTAGGPEVARMIDSFLDAIGSTIGKRAMPAVHAAVEPDHSESVRAGQRVSAARAPVWLRIERGSALFAGDDRLRLDATSPASPVTTGSWVEAREELHVVGGGTVSLLETNEAELWRGMDAARLLFLAWLERRLALEDAEDIAQLRQKSEADAVGRDRAFVGLAGVFARSRDANMEESDALTHALTTIGKVARIVFQPAPRWEGSRRSDPLGAICRASRVRHRAVALRGRWWRSDAGPLLAFTKHAHVPVSLLPVRGGGYEYVNGATRRRGRMTKGVSEEFEPLAYAFYAATPNRPLEIVDLLRIAFRGLRTEAIMILALALGAAVLGLVLPVATAFLVGSLIPSASVSGVFVLMAALIAVHVGQAMFDIARVFALLRVETRSHATLQSALTDRLLSLPVPFFRQYTVGDLASRIGGINAVRDLFSGVAINALLGGMFAAVYLGLLFSYSSKLGLVAIGLATISALVTVLSGVRMIALQRVEQEVAGKISGLVFQLISGIAKLRVSGAEGRGFAQWGARFAEQKRWHMRAGILQNAVAVFNAVLPLVAVLILYFFVASMPDSNGPGGSPLLSTPEFIAFSAAFGVVLRAGASLSGTLVQLLAAIPLIERARPILSAAPEAAADRPDPGELTGRIELAHVSFRYSPDGPLVLDDVSLATRPGEFIALVGPSGSGKSTLLRLLLGFETLESGAVLYDGQDLSTVDLTAVRTQLGVVLQHGRIMAGDILRNVIGSAPLTVDDAWEAVTAAGLEDDIKAMPMGLNTVMSEGGATLSGGQRQRLLIARAIVQRPRILLFDEATSALDNRTQDVVTESLARINATRIVVAHRLSTIRNADRIYVLNAGRIVEQGGFGELMALGGLFERLVRRQVV